MQVIFIYTDDFLLIILSYFFLNLIKWRKYVNL